MKFVLVGLAIVAAVAALIFVPPNHDRIAGLTRPATTAVDPTASKVTAEGVLASAATRPTADPRSVRRPTALRVVVYVAGEVLRPGVYELPADARAAAALARAGGPKPQADLVAVNLAAHLQDGDEIAVPKLGAELATRRARGPRVPAAQRSHRPHRQRHPKAAVASSVTLASVDLNAADADELATLPGIGPALAERIVAYRTENGPFTSVDELADIAGITPRLQDALANIVVIR